MGRRLERHIDQDLVERMLAGWKPKKDEKKSRKRTARKSKSGKPRVKEQPFAGPILLNRSRHLPSAASYEEARALSRRMAA